MNILAVVAVVLSLAACQRLGRAVTVNVNRDDVQQMANFALAHLNTHLESQNTLVSVVQAKTQVVAGINYILTLEIKNGQETKICDVTIWDQPWTHMTRMTHHSCVNTKEREGVTT